MTQNRIKKGPDTRSVAEQKYDQEQEDKLNLLRTTTDKQRARIEFKIF